MIARTIVALLATALLLLAAAQLPLAHGGGGAPEACNPSPPSQATTAPASYSRLAVCAALGTMNAVDRANSEAPGFALYPAPVLATAPVTPPASITHDGTGVAFIDPVSNTGKGLGLAGRSGASPFYVGMPITGGFYVELDMKFANTPPGGVADWPAVWFGNLAHWLNFSCPSVGGAYPYLEVDMFEYFSGSVGNPAMNLNAWDCVSGSRAVTSQVSIGWSKSGIDFSTYHTYGFLWVPMAANGGTGLLKAYFDNVLKASCSYATGAAPSCDSGKPAGTYSILDAQGPNAIVIASYDQGASPTTIRNLHLWQAP